MILLYILLCKLIVHVILVFPKYINSICTKVEGDICKKYVVAQSAHLTPGCWSSLCIASGLARSLVPIMTTKQKKNEAKMW